MKGIGGRIPWILPPALLEITPFLRVLTILSFKMSFFYNTIMRQFYAELFQQAG